MICSYLLVITFNNLTFLGNENDIGTQVHYEKIENLWSHILELVDD